MATQEQRLRDLAAAIRDKINSIPRGGVPNGGAAGQVLQKWGDGDGQASWDWNGQYPYHLRVEDCGTYVGQGFQRLLMISPYVNDGGRWDSNNYWYNCPFNGWYLITGSVRVTDNTPSGTQFGLGVAQGEFDGAHFFWHKVGPGPASRETFAYARVGYYNAGDCLRMFSYSDQGYQVTQAGLQIALLRRA